MNYFIHTSGLETRQVDDAACDLRAFAMPIVVPPAHKLDALIGEYGPTDEATSGGDIGAQLPIFPVVWVSLR